MKNAFSEEEKAQLRQLINHPLFRRAVNEALNTIWRSQMAASGQEASALAFCYYKGACEALTSIYAMSDEVKMLAPRSNRLNHKA